jgi:hypothetical protein
MKKKKKYDGERYLYEVMDRAYSMTEIFDTIICKHPSVGEDKELNKLADEVMGKLYDFYQLAGSKNYDAWEKEGKK